MKIRLIEIGEGGVPARCPGTLPPAARDALEGTAALYEAVGFSPPWVGYLADRDGDVVGSAAFMGAPQNGEVELAFQIFPEFEGRGLGRELTRQLLRLVATQDPSLTVVAHSAPRHAAARALLGSVGFAADQLVDHPDQGLLQRWTRRAGDALA